MGHICLKSSWEGWARFALPSQCKSNKAYMHYYIDMMDIKNEDEDGIHSHMLLGKKRGGLSPILVSRIESLLNFLEMNLCSILSVCFSNRTSGEYQVVHLIERQGISGNTSLIPG